MTKQCQHLNTTDCYRIINLLKKYKYLFGVTLGTWNTTSVDLELEDDAKPVCSWTYPVPRVHEAMFRKEVERLVILGVPKEAGAPYFAQPKAKTNCVRFLSDFRNLNRYLKCNPYPILKIREILLNLQGFQYATPLHLNMGCYHIRLSEQAIKICTIILLQGKYRYKCLQIGVSNSLGIFQEKMNEMFCGFEFIQAYIDDLLIITRGDWYDYFGKIVTKTTKA